MKVSAPLLPRARVYLLVRPEGKGPGSSSRRPWGRLGVTPRESRGEVRFGLRSEAGGRFELLVVATTVALPPAPLPELTGAAVTLASATAWPSVRRRFSGRRRRGDAELAVREISRTEVVAHDLPAESIAGLGIHPPGSHEHWVRPELAETVCRNSPPLLAPAGRVDGPLR